MEALLAELITPQMQSAFQYVVYLIAVLYVLSVVWVVKDAYIRGTMWYVWGIVALVPFLGAIAYTLLRPPLLALDKNEQELEIALKRRQLTKYGECAVCSYPVESDYILCPHCQTRLKNQCVKCNRALDPSWRTCPYCTTPVAQAANANQRPMPQAAQRSSQSQSIQRSATHHPSSEQGLKMSGREPSRSSSTRTGIAKSSVAMSSSPSADGQRSSSARSSSARSSSTRSSSTRSSSARSSSARSPRQN